MPDCNFPQHHTGGGSGLPIGPIIVVAVVVIVAVTHPELAILAGVAGVAITVAVKMLRRRLASNRRAIGSSHTINVIHSLQADSYALHARRQAAEMRKLRGQVARLQRQPAVNVHFHTGPQQIQNPAPEPDWYPVADQPAVQPEPARIVVVPDEAQEIWRRAIEQDRRTS